MDRPLTVSHEETPGTNPLLTGFLIIAALVLLASALEGALAEAPTDAPPPAPAAEPR